MHTISRMLCAARYRLGAVLAVLLGVGCEPARESRASEQASAHDESSGGEVEAAPVRKVDGLDLIMTPAQRYGREYGSCDFRDASVPSPLDRVHLVRVVMDVREGGKVNAVDASFKPIEHAPLGGLVKRLKALSGRLRACGPLEPVDRSMLNSGTAVPILLMPVTCGAPPQVTVEGENDETISKCVTGVLSNGLGGLELGQQTSVALLGFRGTVGGDELPLAPIDKDDIRRTIHASLGEVQACYEPALEIWPELRGSVVVRFAISTADGSVLDARVVHDEPGNRALACCVARKVYGWKFAATGKKGFTIVTYPFILGTVAE